MRLCSAFQSPSRLQKEVSRTRNHFPLPVRFFRGALIGPAGPRVSNYRQSLELPDSSVRTEDCFYGHPSNRPGSCQPGHFNVSSTGYAPGFHFPVPPARQSSSTPAPGRSTPGSLSTAGSSPYWGSASASRAASPPSNGCARAAVALAVPVPTAAAPYPADLPCAVRASSCRSQQFIRPVVATATQPDPQHLQQLVPAAHQQRAGAPHFGHRASRSSRARTRSSTLSAVSERPGRQLTVNTYRHRLRKPCCLQTAGC